MEHVPVTVDEVRRILAGERPSSVTEVDQSLVLGYREATTGCSAATARSGRSAGDRPEVGHRPANRSRGLRSPPFELVPTLVDRACIRMEERHEHPAMASGWIHVAAAAIHPLRT